MEHVVKMNIKNLVPRRPNGLRQAWLKLGMMLAAGFMAASATAQTNFASAQVISGDWGSVTNDNTGVVADVGVPAIAGYPANAPLWYVWTAPADGVVSLDTIGSVDDLLPLPLDTVLGVYQGSSLKGLNQIAANDDLYPVNGNTTTISSVTKATVTEFVNSGSGEYAEFPGDEATTGYYPSPFFGPSGLKFNAKGGQTYFIAVDTKHPSAGGIFAFGTGTGMVRLNWAYKSSGVFRFATEDIDPYTLTLLFQTAESESEYPAGPDDTENSVALTYYPFNAPGVLVTVTRVGGSTGRATVRYQTFDGTNIAMANDQPAYAELVTNSIDVYTNYTPENCATNITIVTNISTTAAAYVPVSGTLVFDDFEMSKTILIPINFSYDEYNTNDLVNRVFGIQLIDDGGVTSPLLDPNESPDVSAPRVDPVFGTATVRILNSYGDPYGPDLVPDVITNFTYTETNGACTTNFTYVTNMVTGIPTNVIINFEKTHYRVPADINDPSVSPWPVVTLWVERFGTNSAGATVNYRINNYLNDDRDGPEEMNIYFPLQPGSDYAVPTPATIDPIRGTNSDFVLTTGTLTFPSGNTEAAFVQPLTFTVPPSTLTRFNKDFKIEMYHEISYANQTVPALLGMVGETTVTILFNDQNPPAGSVDEFYNADFNSEMATYPTNVPATSPPDDPNPGVGLFGEVYSMALLANNECFIGGDFQSYNGIASSCVALVDTNGMLDTSFNPGDGANGAVNAVAAYGSEFYLGGSFSAYNGTQVGSIARVYAGGALDTSFNPGVGADGTVRAVAVTANGEVLVGGDFTHINGASCNYLALLKPDGTLDTTFNAGTALSGSVYAITLQTNGQILVGGNFSVAGKTYNNLARLNTNGVVDATFNPGTGADNVVHALAVQLEGQILVGGEFTHFNGLPMNGIARLGSTGALDTSFYPGSGADAPVFCIAPMDVIVATNYFTNTIITQTSTNVIIDTNYIYATGGIYVGGAFASLNGTHRLGFGRLYPNGTVDTTFMDTAYNQFAGLKRIYSSDTPAVLATAIQSDGKILIGGSFNQVGGGQANTNVCNTLDTELSLYYPSDIISSYGDTNLWVEPKTRDGVRNRSGLARLIGGATPGPGNLGFAAGTYSANRSQSALTVSLVRTNGNLGPAAANFAIQSGTAQSGADYSYDGAGPMFWLDSQFLTHESRERSDGLSGQSGFLVDPYGLSLTLADQPVNQLSEVLVSVNASGDKQNQGNLDANLQLANPSLDSFYLGGEEIPLGTALGASAAPLTIVDDTSYAGNFGFSASTYIATNATLPITLVRSNGTFGVVTMLCSSTNITAMAGPDYIGITNKSIVFNGNQLTNSFNVTINNDGYITNVEKTFNLRLFKLATTTGAGYGISNATVRIINPSFQGYVTLAATNFGGTVSSGALNFVVNRIAGSLGTITVQFATTNGTALSGTDYVGTTNTLTWNSGDVSPRTVSIPLLNPHAVGATKQFSVHLSNPMLNSGQAPSLLAQMITNATLTITNDNSAGSLQFASASYLVNENGGYAAITVIRTGGNVGSITAQFTTTNGTAVKGVNFVATNGPITLAAGQDSATFNVAILNDHVVDPPPASFYFNVLLNTTNGLNNTAVHIVDAQSYNYPPGTPDPSFNTNGMNGDVLALGLQANGQIIAGGNFTAVGPVPVGELARLNTDGSLDTTFLNGLAGANAAINTLAVQTDSRILLGGAFTYIDGVRRNFIARVMTDGTLDTSFNPGSGADNVINTVFETFINGVRRIYIGGAFGSVNGVSSPGLARLDADTSDNNNDGAPDPSFNVGSGADGQVYAVAAYPTNSIFAGKVLVGGAFAHFNGVSVTNLVRLNVDGSLDTAFNANLGAGPNDSIQALAVGAGDQVLVGGRFTQFNTTAINRICRLNNDGTLDTNFTAALGAGVADDSVAAITIQTDGRILLVGGFAQVNGLTRNHITRLLPTGAPDPTINFGSGANGNVDAVVVQPADGKIVIGGSFTEYDGQPAAGIARLYGGSETGSGAFSFAQGDFVVNSDGVYAPIEIIRTGGTSGTNADGSGDIYVQFSASGGTATPGINYGPVTATVDFPAGEVQQTVLVPVFNENVYSIPSWTVNLALTNATPPATNGSQPTATLIIVNANSAVAFSQGYYTQAKDTPTGIAVIDVVRLGGTNTTASVEFSTTTNGTAVIGTDYYPTNGTLTFLPGQNDIQFQIPIVNNNLTEGNRTVDLTLTNAVNMMLMSPSNAVLTILDTTTNAGQLYFGLTNVTAVANQGVAYLPVLRTNGYSGSVTVHYDLYPGTAVPGINYVAASGTLTFGPSVTAQSLPVQLVNSGIIQAPVSLTVALSNPSGGSSITGPTNATLTILNTNSVINFTQGTNTVPENAGVLNVLVARYDNTNISASVQYATTNGAGVNAAFAGTNFVQTAGTLDFAPGVSLASITIPLINQSNTMDRVFGVNLFNPVNGFVVIPSNTVVVLQGAAAGVTFTTNLTTTFNNAGYVPITVVCSNPRVEPLPTTNLAPLEVTYTTVDGTAKAGFDYNRVTGKIIFTNGIGTNTFNVPLLLPQTVSSNVAFSVILTNVTWPGQITPYGAETVVIDESRSGFHFSQPSYSVYKNSGVAVITVDRTGYTNDYATVDYAITNGTAIAGQSFVATNGTLAFTNGVTSQTFNVSIIVNPVVQPNLYALLELNNPSTNAQVVYPALASLGILENGGSYVVPAGALLLSSSSVTNMNADVIGSNDTVQVQFAFRDAAGLNVTNLIAYLLATNGVTSPSPASQTYGPLTVYGHSVSEPFTFTAHGTNMLPISPTFMLYDNGKFIGPASFAFTVGTMTSSYTNSSAIVINDGAAATPYPSIMKVAGAGNTLVKATVTINSLSHQNFPDIDALLLSPTTNTLLMGHVGTPGPVKQVTLTFDDAATNSLPANGSIATGTNKPTQYGTIPNFP